MKFSLYLGILVLAVSCAAQQANVYADPCQNPFILKSSTPIALATTTATAIVAAVSGKIVYVCGATFTLAGTSPTAIFSSAATCGSSPTNLTGTYAPTSGSVIPIGSHGATSFKTASSANLCLTLGGTSPSAQGVATFVLQ